MAELGHIIFISGKKMSNDGRNARDKSGTVCILQKFGHKINILAYGPAAWVLVTSWLPHPKL